MTCYPLTLQVSRTTFSNLPSGSYLTLFASSVRPRAIRKCGDSRRPRSARVKKTFSQVILRKTMTLSWTKISSQDKKHRAL